MIKKFSMSATDERVQVPELVMFDEIRVIAREHEIRIVLQKQIRDVVQMHEPIQRGRAEAFLLAKFVAEQPGGFGHVVDEICALGRRFLDVMVNDDPFRLVEARFVGEVRDPRGLFAQIALLPIIVVVSLQRNVLIEKFSRQFFQQQAGNQAVKVALVGENNVRLGQLHHAASLVQSATHGER